MPAILNSLISVDAHKLEHTKAKSKIKSNSTFVNFLKPKDHDQREFWIVIWKFPFLSLLSSHLTIIMCVHQIDSYLTHYLIWPDLKLQYTTLTLLCSSFSLNCWFKLISICICSFSTVSLVSYTLDAIQCTSLNILCDDEIWWWKKRY